MNSKFRCFCLVLWVNELKIRNCAKLRYRSLARPTLSHNFSKTRKQVGHPQLLVKTFQEGVQSKCQTRAHTIGFFAKSNLPQLQNLPHHCTMFGHTSTLQNAVDNEFRIVKVGNILGWGNACEMTNFKKRLSTKTNHLSISWLNIKSAELIWEWIHLLSLLTRFDFFKIRFLPTITTFA